MAAMQEMRSTDAWARRWAWGGVAFVVLVVAWIVMVLALEPAAFDSTDEEITSFFADGDSDGVLLAALFMAAAVVAFMMFLGALRSALRVAEGGTGRMSAVSFGGGVLLAGILLLMNAITFGIAFAVAAEGIDVDPAAYRLVDSVFFGLTLHLGVAAAIMIAPASIIARISGVFPAWLRWLGVITSVLAFFSALLFGLPLVLVLIWIAAASWTLARGPSREAPPAPNA
jgi:hypothetical protein